MFQNIISKQLTNIGQGRPNRGILTPETQSAELRLSCRPAELMVFAPLQNHKPGRAVCGFSWGAGQQPSPPGEQELASSSLWLERGSIKIWSVCREPVLQKGETTHCSLSVPPEHNSSLSCRTCSGHAAPARAHRRLRCWRSAPDFSISPHQLPMSQSRTGSVQKHLTNSSRPYLRLI